MRKAGLASLIVLCFAGGLAGCTSEATSPSTVGADDEARVGALIDRFFGLAEKQDWDSVGELLSEDFEIYFDEASAFSKTAYLDLLKGEDLEVLSWRLEGLEIRVAAGRGMAWSKYRGFFDHGEGHRVETVETLVFRNRGEGWKITHAHASVKSLDASAEAPGS